MPEHPRESALRIVLKNKLELIGINSGRFVIW